MALIRFMFHSVLASYIKLKKMFQVGYTSAGSIILYSHFENLSVNIDLKYSDTHSVGKQLYSQSLT